MLDTCKETLQDSWTSVRKSGARPAASLPRQVLFLRCLMLRYPLRLLVLHGAYKGRDEAGPASDIDILVDFQGRADFDRYMDLKFFLEGLLQRRVDLVTRAALKPRMRPIVEREAIRVA
jgi:hypothetical protein